MCAKEPQYLATWQGTLHAADDASAKVLYWGLTLVQRKKGVWSSPATDVRCPQALRGAKSQMKPAPERTGGRSLPEAQYITGSMAEQ